MSFSQQISALTNSTTCDVRYVLLTGTTCPSNWCLVNLTRSWITVVQRMRVYLHLETKSRHNLREASEIRSQTVRFLCVSVVAWWCWRQSTRRWWLYANLTVSELPSCVWSLVFCAPRDELLLLSRLRRLSGSLDGFVSCTHVIVSKQHQRQHTVRRFWHLFSDVDVSFNGWAFLLGFGRCTVGELKVLFVCVQKVQERVFCICIAVWDYAVSCMPSTVNNLHVFVGAQ